MTEATVRAPLDQYEFCDKCPARAKVGASFLHGELYFCGHHAKFYAQTLIVQALKVYDPDNFLLQD